MIELKIKLSPTWLNLGVAALCVALAVATGSAAEISKAFFGRGSCLPLFDLVRLGHGCFFLLPGVGAAAIAGKLSWTPRFWLTGSIAGYSVLLAADLPYGCENGLLYPGLLSFGWIAATGGMAAARGLSSQSAEDCSFCSSNCCRLDWACAAAACLILSICAILLAGGGVEPLALADESRLEEVGLWPVDSRGVYAVLAALTMLASALAVPFVEWVLGAFGRRRLRGWRLAASTALTGVGFTASFAMPYWAGWDTHDAEPLLFASALLPLVLALAYRVGLWGQK